jgi:hypothetical protein
MHEFQRFRQEYGSGKSRDAVFYGRQTNKPGIPVCQMAKSKGLANSKLIWAAT